MAFFWKGCINSFSRSHCILSKILEVRDYNLKETPLAWSIRYHSLVLFMLRITRIQKVEIHKGLLVFFDSDWMILVFCFCFFVQVLQKGLGSFFRWGLELPQLVSLRFFGGSKSMIENHSSFLKKKKLCSLKNNFCQNWIDHSIKLNHSGFMSIWVYYAEFLNNNKVQTSRFTLLM